MGNSFSTNIAWAYGQHSEKYTSVLEPMLKPMADEIVSLADLNGEESLLDLATGTGLVARNLLLHAGSVTGIDLARGMLMTAKSLPPEGVAYVNGDAQRLPFRAGCFDVVTCAISLSHFPDVQAALSEVCRVLRPGGAFIASAWGINGKNPSKDALIEVRKRFFDDIEQFYGGKLSEETWADVGKGSETLQRAGFTGIRTKTTTLSGEYQDHEQALETALAWPITRNRIALLDPVEQDRLRAESAAALRAVEDLRWRNEMIYYCARNG